MRASIAVAFAAACLAQAPPSQVLLTTTSIAGEFTVSWTTLGSAETPEFVSFSDSASMANARNATSTSTVFDDSGNVAPRRIHLATLTGLPPNEPVFYTLAGNATVYSATYAPARPGGKVYAVFADFGLVDDYALSTLLADSAAGVFDAVVFGGDFAYDLQDSNGAVGDQFMDGLTPVFSSHPVYTCAGNHEVDVNSDFANYNARFAAMVPLGTASGSDSGRWYSLNDGPVHWVLLDTEIYSYGTAAQVAAQKAWLTADLAAVDRSATPWLLVACHKAPWDKNTDWAALGFDALFDTYQVDVVFLGHTHNYQRNQPMDASQAPSDPACVTGPASNSTYTDCAGTVVLTVGSPGMNQGMGTRLSPADLLVTSLLNWGYGYLTVVSPAELRWHWFETVAAGPDGRGVAVARDAGVMDDAVFRKTKGAAPGLRAKRVA